MVKRDHNGLARGNVASNSNVRRACKCHLRAGARATVAIALDFLSFRERRRRKHSVERSGRTPFVHCAFCFVSARVCSIRPKRYANLFSLSGPRSLPPRAFPFSRSMYCYSRFHKYFPFIFSFVEGRVLLPRVSSFFPSVVMLIRQLLS